MIARSETRALNLHGPHVQSIFAFFSCGKSSQKVDYLVYEIWILLHLFVEITQHLPISSIFFNYLDVISCYHGELTTSDSVKLPWYGGGDDWSKGAPDWPVDSYDNFECCNNADCAIIDALANVVDGIVWWGADRPVTSY